MIAGELTSSFSPAARSVRLCDAEPPRRQGMTRGTGLVDPRSDVRCAIRDTRAAEAERYYWTVTVLGEPDPGANGRVGDTAAAWSRAEAGFEPSVPRRSAAVECGTDGQIRSHRGANWSLGNPVARMIRSSPISSGRLDAHF